MELHIDFITGPIVVPAAEGRGREIGAEVEFRGIVREMERGEVIPGLHYEAYLPMAERKIQRIMDRLGETWPCNAAWFIHRLGWVPVGEASLYIRVHAPHRDGAFRFCMALIDELKKDVPIWKMAGPAP